MGAIRDFLNSVGRTKTSYTGSDIPGPPPAETASAADKAAFDESVRKYQLDRRAYEQYNTELNNRIRAFNPYADSQYRIASTAPAPATTTPGQTPAPPATVSVPTAPAPTAPTQLRAPTYGAISQFSNLTPQQQGELYLQQRNIGYTDADIRKATAAQVGTPNESTWTGYLQTAYPDYTRAVEQQYGTLFNRTGFGGGAQQIDNPGFNYWVNQLSSGAVAPQDLASSMRSAAATTPTPTPVTTPGTTAPTSDINALYQQYFNRQAEPEGLQYWQQSGLTGDALRNAIIAGAQGPDLDYYNSVYNRPNDPGHSAARGGYISKYAEGGRVRTHYQTGGRADEGNLEELDAFYRDPRNFTQPQSAPIRRSPAASPVMSPSDPGYLDRIVSQPIGTNPRSERNILDPNTSYGRMYPANAPRRAPPENLMPIENVGEGAGINEEPPARISGLMEVANTGEEFPVSGVVEPAAGAQTVEPPQAAGPPRIQDLLARYIGGSGEGSRELAGARQRYQSEANAFSDMIRQMSERAESPTSRAEMYFRLAAAFGSPTRTGSMGETLGKVGEQMGEYTKGRRAEEAERRGLTLRAQEARLAGAREDLQTTRALSAQEASERRALTSATLQEYIRSGRPQSRAGQMAIDAGLSPGTQAFQDFVRRHSELDIQRAQQLIQAQNENITLRRDAADRLSATEIRLADETSQNISSARDNAILLREAIRLNPNASPSNLTEGVITDLRARLGSTDPLVVNTRDIRNILSRLSLGSLKETFPGAISNDERRALEAVSGVTAASREERARIMQRASDALDRIIERNEAQFRRIREGEFGRIDRTRGGTQ